MLYLDYSRDDWVPNVHGGRENLEAVAFLQEMNATVYREVPGVVTIAEESTAWPGVTRPTHLGGLGFGFKWNMGWMHDSLAYIERAPVYRSYHHGQLTFSMMYAYSENYVLPISHDEVVYGKGSLLRKMPGDRWQQLANLRAYLAYMWAHPGKQLLFMGSEFGQDAEWAESRSLDWWHLDDPAHRGILQLVTDLNSRYKELDALWSLDVDPAGFQWIDANDATGNVLSFLRYGKPAAAGDGATERAGSALACVANFSGAPHHGYRIGLPAAGPLARGAELRRRGLRRVRRRQPRRRRGRRGAVARPAVLRDGGRSPARHRLVPARGLRRDSGAPQPRGAPEVPEPGLDRAFCRLPIASPALPTAGLPWRGRGPMRQLLRRALPTAVVVRAPRRLRRGGRHRPGLTRHRRAGRRRPGRVPDHGGQRHRDRPVRAQRPHRPERLLAERLPGVLRRGLHAPGERLLLRRLRTTSTRAPTPTPASAATAPRPIPDEVAGNAFYDPACDLIAYDRALLEELVDRLRPVPGPGRHGPRVRPRHAGPVRLRRERPEHPGRDPGRLPRRRLDRVGRRRARPSTSRCAPRSSTTSSAVSCSSGTTSAATPTTARRTGPTSTASPPSTRASTAAWARAATTSATTGCSRRRRSRTTATSTAAATRRSRTSPRGSATTLPEFWSEVFPTAFDGDFTPPAVEGFDGTAPDCAGVEGRDLGYCADDDTVYLDETDLATPAYDDIGDFALTTALSLPYSLAVRDQAGLSIDDGAATRSAVCLTGWYEAQWFNGAFTDTHRRRHQPRRHRRGRPVPARVRRPARGLPEHVGVRLRAGRGLPHRLPAGRRRLRPRPLKAQNRARVS